MILRRRWKTRLIEIKTENFLVTSNDFSALRMKKSKKLKNPSIDFFLWLKLLIFFSFTFRQSLKSRRRKIFSLLNHSETIEKINQIFERKIVSRRWSRWNNSEKKRKTRTKWNFSIYRRRREKLGFLLTELKEKFVKIWEKRVFLEFELVFDEFLRGSVVFEYFLVEFRRSADRKQKRNSKNEKNNESDWTSVEIWLISRSASTTNVS